MIQKGDRSQFDTEILKQLLKLLPESHEVCSEHAVLMELGVLGTWLEILPLVEQEAVSRSRVGHQKYLCGYFTVLFSNR